MRSMGCSRPIFHCVDRCATALPAALELSGSLSTVMLQCYTITDGGPGISKKFGQAAVCNASVCESCRQLRRSIHLRQFLSKRCFVILPVNASRSPGPHDSSIVEFVIKLLNTNDPRNDHLENECCRIGTNRPALPFASETKSSTSAMKETPAAVSHHPPVQCT